MALRFIDLAIAKGDLKFGYGAIAAHLEIMTGEEHTVGMVAGLLDREGKRRPHEKQKPPAADRRGLRELSNPSRQGGSHMDTKEASDA
jgi:hypothetical protein